MDNFKRNYLRRTLSLVLAVIMMITLVPLGVFAQGETGTKTPDATSSATYYKKANWENKIKDKSRWKVEDDQTLVRVGGGDPVQMNDIDYDGMFIDANGRYVIRLVYKEKSQAVSGVWYRALINFGDLDKFIDFGLSYVLGKDGKTQYKFDPVPKFKGRGFDLGLATGDRTNNRANLPINLVLKEGVDLKTLGEQNYIVQMRVANGDYTRIYAYAPKGTSMDYSTYTKTTAVDLADKLGTLFIKGGKQSDQKNATNQEFFMSEFIANPEQYPDKSKLGIIRTQYMGQTNTIVRETVGGEPIAFTQVFDANLVKYLKADTKGNVAYVNVLTNGRVLSPVTKNVGIPKDKINYSEGDKLAYIVIGTKAFQKEGVKVVNVDKLDQHVMLSGFYITAIDYVVDKGQFENTFSNDKVRKLNYAMMSGWTNPNTNGWVIYEKKYGNDYVVPEGESYLIDTGDDPSGGQIMLQVGGDQAILRKPQGYYNGYITGDGANDAIEKYANGVYKITLREGATILPGKKLKVYMPYTSSHEKPVNFLEIHNGSKHNQGAAELTLLTNRNINMHIYKPGNGSYKLKFTLRDGNQGEIEFTKGITWKDNDKNKIIKGLPNRALLGTGGNFELDTTKLQTGADIFVESYDGRGKKIDSETSWFKYRALTKSKDNVKLLTWVDHSDKKSVLSINKSLYTPYQLLFTNDYEGGSAYKDPKALPTNDSDFNKDTTSFVGYTKYDGGKVRTLYEEGTIGKYIAKVEADENDYDDKGNLKGDDVRKTITIPKANIFDAQFAKDSKDYRAYEYTVDLGKMKAYQSDDKTEHKLELLKDMKFVSTASDGSSLPSDLLETRVRARVLFDTTEGKFADNTKKVVKIVPDNIKFYGEAGYAANGFEGDNVEANTGDKFPEAPQATGNKKFLGWVTAEGKNTLNNKTTVSSEEFNKVDKKDVFRADTPVTKHLIVYAIYSDETAVTFDANGGKFTNDKEQTTVKADNGSVTAPTDRPTRDGYEFKGWAATKDATEADANILNNVTEPKTVYAVWEKTAEEALQLKNPEKPVEVKDPTSLTSDEIAKVKKAVADANKDKDITEADITVAEDGTVTVKKGNQTGTIAKENTVTQKLVENKFNPPKKPVEVENAKALSEDEIKQVKQAVKDANPDRNFKDEDIKVEADGTVKINQNGKVGTIPANKTVVQKDTILDLNKPEEKDKVEVKNPANLSQKERDEVADAVKEANKNKITNNADVTVDSKGNVTVKDGTKTGTLEAKDTVKPFTRDGKTLNPPAQKVKVGDTNNLNEAEKQAVRDAVKAANPELDFKDDEIQVDSNGAVTVPMGDTKTGNIPANETVEAAKDTDNIIKLVAPAKTPVANKEKLTQTEKDKVIEEVKKANQNLPEDVNIEVSDDGTVTVTQGTEPNQKVGQLSPKDTVEEKLKKPTINAAKDGSVTVKPADENAKEIDVTYKDPTGGEKTLKAEKNQSTGKWTLPGNTDKDITVDENTGEITLPADKLKNDAEVSAVAKAGEKTSEAAKVNAKDTTAPGVPTVVSKDDGAIEITPPGDDDTSSITIAYKDQAGNLQTLTATKGDDGNWTLPDGTDASITIDKKTGAVTLPKDKIKAGEKVTATAKDANNNVSKAGEATPVDKTELKTEAAKETETKDSDKYKNADETKKKAYDDALAKAKDVLAKKDATQDDVNKALKDLQDAEKALDGTTKPADELKDPAKVAVKDPSKLTDDEKAAIKDAVKKANPGLTDDQIAVDKEGNVTVTKEGEQPKTIGKDKTVSKDVNAPAITEVANKSKLTPDEKTAVKEAVKTANTGLTDDKIEVKDDGTVVVTKDGKETTIPASDVVTQKATPGAPAAPAVKANDDGTVSVTPPIDADLKSVTIEYTDPQGIKQTVTATKNGDEWTFEPASSGLTIDESGNIVIPKEQVKPGTVVSAKAKNADNKESTPGTANVPSLADKYAPEYTEADGAVGTKSTITGPNFKDAQGQDTTKPANITFELGQNAPQGASVDANGTVTYTPTAADEGKEIKIPVVVKYSDGSTDNVEVKITVVDIKAPAAPKVKAEDNGDVTITPPTDNDLKSVEVKYTPEGQTTPVTVTATKGNDNKWTLPADAPEGLQINPNTGEITIPADKIKGGTEVSAVAKDAEDKSSDPAKADAKLDSNEDLDFDLLDFGNIDITPVANMYLLTDDEKNEVENKVKAAVDAAIKAKKPTAKITPSIEVADDGTVTVSLGNKTKTIDSVKTVEQKSDGLAVKPAKPIPVDNPNQLTDAEKKAIEDAIRNANHPDLDNANIEVNDEGKVTITTPNGKSATIPANKTRTKKSIPDYADIYYPDTTIGVGDERRIYPSGYPGYVSTLPEGIDAPRGVYVRVNHDGSVDVEISPRYTGPSMFTITGYVDVDGKIAPISIRIRVIDDVRSDRRRQRMDKRDEMDKEDELIDTREVLTHKAYIFGYPDGTVRPNGFITRAEAAAMLSRLLNEENTSSAAKPAFIDTPSKWYNNAINAVVARGIMRGYSDGTFRPNAPITRAEFAQMISAIDAKPFGTAPFADVKGHWAELAIGKEYAAGRISGYPNGTFRPDAPITRAEAAHILNKIFERNYDLVSALQSEDKGNIKFFTDLSTSFWGYNDMIEATNTHTFRRRSKGLISEDWDNINR